MRVYPFSTALTSSGVHQVPLACDQRQNEGNTGFWSTWVGLLCLDTGTAERKGEFVPTTHGQDGVE